MDRERIDHVLNLNLWRTNDGCGEGRELLQRFAIFGADLKQGRGGRGQFEEPLHDLRRHEEGNSNLWIDQPLFAQRHKRTEPDERGQEDALHVASKRIVLCEDRGPRIPQDVGNVGRLRRPFLLHQQSHCLEPAVPVGNEIAVLDAIVTQYGPYAQALEVAVAGDDFGLFLYGHASLDAPRVGLSQHQFVESNVP